MQYLITVRDVDQGTIIKNIIYIRLCNFTTSMFHLYRILIVTVIVN